MALRPNRLIATLLLAFALFAVRVSTAAEEPQKMNLNTASAQELTSLRGIGDKTAQAIVEYRQSHGPFKSVEELVEVKGIGDKLLASLKDHVTVSAAPAAAPAPAAAAEAPKPKPGS